MLGSYQLLHCELNYGALYDLVSELHAIKCFSELLSMNSDSGMVGKHGAELRFHFCALFLSSFKASEIAPATNMDVREPAF